jgi:hypothetical protein
VPFASTLFGTGDGSRKPRFFRGSGSVIRWGPYLSPSGGPRASKVASRGALSAPKRCAERLFIISLSQIGGSRVTNLGHPAHLRSKDTGDHNLPEKRGQAKSANRTPRKTRVVWPRLDCFKSNPDRDKGGPAAMLTQRGVTACRCVRLLRSTSPCGEIPGDDSGRRDEWTT